MQWELGFRFTYLWRNELFSGKKYRRKERDVCTCGTAEELFVTRAETKF